MDKIQFPVRPCGSDLRVRRSDRAAPGCSPRAADDSHRDVCRYLATARQRALSERCGLWRSAWHRRRLDGGGPTWANELRTHAHTGSGRNGVHGDSNSEIGELAAQIGPRTRRTPQRRDGAVGLLVGRTAAPLSTNKEGHSTIAIRGRSRARVAVRCITLQASA